MLPFLSDTPSKPTHMHPSYAKKITAETIHQETLTYQRLKIPNAIPLENRLLQDLIRSSREIFIFPMIQVSISADFAATTSITLGTITTLQTQLFNSRGIAQTQHLNSIFKR